jgi:hypothetical protein
VYGGEMSKETENRLKTELDKLDELAATGVHLLGEYMNDPESEVKKSAYHETCMMINNQFTDCAVLLRDCGYAPDFEKAVKLLGIVGAHRLSNAI